MLLEVFNVEHGACALITTDDGRYVMIDCGHNSTTDWKPGNFLAARQIREIEALIVTNYDEDHVSGFPNLIDKVHVNFIYRNGRVSTNAIRHMKSKEGMGPGIRRLVYELENVFINPGEVDFGSLNISMFSNSYPSDFKDENNLSLATFISVYGKTILFPGDMEADGWSKLLQNPSFRDRLSEVLVLFASHHGRASGICKDIFAHGLCKPYYVVISDKHKGFQTQETTDFYNEVAKGGPFRGDTRYVLTTRRDGNFSFNFRPDSWGPY